MQMYCGNALKGQWLELFAYKMEKPRPISFMTIYSIAIIIAVMHVIALAATVDRTPEVSKTVLPITLRAGGIQR